MMSDVQLMARAHNAIGKAAGAGRVLLVPGGGVFADAVRQVDRNVGLSPDTAHWMAVLAMDQSAEFVAGRLPDGAVVRMPDEIDNVLNSDRIPVLAPSAWLRDSDPLPHSWDVTSDSIAAWVAGRVGASQLVLIKPEATGVHRSGDMRSTGLGLVDPWFSRILPEGLAWTMVGADQIAEAFEDQPRSETHKA